LAISWQLWLGIGSYTFDVFGIEPCYPRRKQYLAVLGYGATWTSLIRSIAPARLTGRKEKGRKGNRAPLFIFPFLQKRLLFVIADRSRRLAHGTADLPPVE
jgi:hypothetical protein